MPHANFRFIQLTSSLRFYMAEELLQRGLSVAITSQAKGLIDPNTDLTNFILISQADQLFHSQVAGEA